jgi:hypothetical protein
MFATRPDRSVGSFPAACGKFVQGSPGGGKRWGKLRTTPSATAAAVLTTTVVVEFRQLSRSWAFGTMRLASQATTEEVPGARVNGRGRRLGASSAA